MKTYSLEFLAWFRRVAFFRDDMFRDLKELGVTPGRAWMLTMDTAARDADVITWYQNNSIDPKDIEKYIDWHHEKYKEIIASQ